MNFNWMKSVKMTKTNYLIHMNQFIRVRKFASMYSSKECCFKQDIS